MTTPSFSIRRPGAANLSIRPPSPSHPAPPAIVTPNNQIQPPRPNLTSPTHSNRSSSTGAAAGTGSNDHPRRGSFETSRSGDGSGPSRRGQLPPWIGNLSPSRRGESKGSYVGAYDNKLVSFLTLQQVSPKLIFTGLIDCIPPATHPATITYVYRQLTCEPPRLGDISSGL